MHPTAALQAADRGRKYLDSIRGNGEAPIDAWPEARPLQRAPLEPTTFPLDALGDTLGNAARAMSEVIQAPEAICGNSVLAAAALAAQAHANLLIDGRRYPISEFFMTLGLTGERKSAVDSIALAPHRQRQMDLVEEYEQEMSRYRMQADAYKKSRDQALTDTKNKAYDAKVKALGELGNEPEEPLKPFLICEEPTYEGLVKMLAYGQPSIGIFSAEGGQFIGGHGMSADNMLKTASGMSGLWDGREISRVRAGEGSSLLIGRRVSAHLMAQPDIAMSMLSNALLMEQGLLSRCLVTWPKSTAGGRFYKEIDLSQRDEIRVYTAQLLDLLSAKPQTREGGKKNELAPRDLAMAPDAKALWIQFHDAVEKKIAEGGELAPIRGLANKAPEHAARLAGILAIVEDRSCADISLRWMKAGIELIQHYLNEALRLYESGVADPDIKDAEALLQWLRAQKWKESMAPLVDVYQRGPNAIRHAKRARTLMLLLQDHGYVRPGIDPDGKRREVWEVRHGL